MSHKLGAVIIALDTLSPSNSDLISDLRTRGISEVLVMSAVTPQEVGKFPPFPIDHDFRNDISLVEQAISHSHNQARILARQQDWNWGLILEEDAIVAGTKDSLNLVIKEVESIGLDSVPLAIHLFPEQHGILRMKKSESLYRIHWVPDYAVGYLLNSSALRRSTELFSSQKLQVADWPNFMRKIKWFAPSQSWVLHPLVTEEISATQKSRKNIQVRISQIRKLVLPGYWIGFVLPILGKVFRLYGAHDIPDENLRSVLIAGPKFLRRWI
jgi:hypothetical protein